MEGISGRRLETEGKTVAPISMCFVHAPVLLFAHHVVHLSVDEFDD